MASTYGAFGVAVALYHRVASGRGQHIDVSTHECAAHIAGYDIPHYSARGRNQRGRNETGREADLYDPFAVKDGYVRFFIVAREQWRRLVEWMGRPPSISGPEFEKTTYRRQHPAIVQSAIAEFCRGFTKEQMYEEGQNGASASLRSTRRESSWRALRPRRASSLLNMDHPWSANIRNSPRAATDRMPWVDPSAGAAAWRAQQRNFFRRTRVLQ